MSTSPQAGFLCVLLLSLGSDSLLYRPSTVQPIARLQSSLLSASRTDMTATPPKKVKDLTLVFCRRTLWNTPDEGCKEILLGLKKRGFGEGKWNGFGGKVEAGETVEEAAKRELLEESGVTAQKLSLRGQLIFNVPSYPSTMRVSVYEAVSYRGDPAESDEMRPQWFKESDLPLKEMWADDAHWMPLFLAGNFFKGKFDFSDEQTIVDYRLWNLPSSETIQI